MRKPSRVDVKPSGRVYRGTSDLGNGDPCPDGHGKTYALPSGRNWCPDQVHDKERVKNG
jgi:hypothetical protein